MKNHLTTIALFAAMATQTLNANALECPEQPKQASKDWQVDVNAAVAKIGPVTGGDLQTKTKLVTQDLLGKLPDAGKIYLEQMMFSAYCTALRDDKTLPEAERANRLRDYSREVRATIRSESVPRSDVAWKRAWITIQDTDDLIYYSRWMEHLVMRADDVLKVLSRLDVSMDPKLLKIRNGLIKRIRSENTERNRIPLENGWVVIRIGKDDADRLDDLRVGIRDAAIAHGVRVEAQGARNE